MCLAGSAVFFGQGIAWAEGAPELNRNDDAMFQASIAGKMLEILTLGSNTTFKYCISTRVNSQQSQIGDFELQFENITETVAQDEASLESFFASDSDLDIIQRTMAGIEGVSLTSLAANVQPEDIVRCESAVTFTLEKLLGILPQLTRLSKPSLT